MYTYKGYIRSEGYGRTKEATLQISGMTCAACAARIEKGLKRLDGVQDANVNLALENQNRL
ncbi:heavy metal-associated domain-containing protein [Bacillus licheniformis]|nr:heavy metal-associated domain-containing protein [Bacillus licheniformis]